LQNKNEQQFSIAISAPVLCIGCFEI